MEGWVILSGPFRILLNQIFLGRLKEGFSNGFRLERRAKRSEVISRLYTPFIFSGFKRILFWIFSMSTGTTVVTPGVGQPEFVVTMGASRVKKIVTSDKCDE